MKTISCVMMVDYYHKYIKASLSINRIYNHIYLLGTSKYESFENIEDLMKSNMDVYIFSTYALQYNLLQTKDLKTINNLDFENVFWIFDEIDFKQYNDSEYNISDKKVSDNTLKKIVKKYFYKQLSLSEETKEEEKKVESKDEKAIKEEKGIREEKERLAEERQRQEKQAKLIIQKIGISFQK